MFQFALKLPEINQLLLKHQKPIPKLQTPSDLNYWETLRTDFTQQMSIDVGNLHYPFYNVMQFRAFYVISIETISNKMIDMFFQLIATSEQFLISSIFLTFSGGYRRETFNP